MKALLGLKDLFLRWFAHMPGKFELVVARRPVSYHVDLSIGLFDHLHNMSK